MSLVTYGSRGGSVYATAIVPELVESGGTCTLTAVGQGQTLTTTIAGVGATSATNCGIMTIPTGPGDWALSVTYESRGDRGVSPEQTVTVP